MSGAELSASQKTTLYWARHLKAEGELYMPDFSTARTVAALVRKGLMCDAGEAKHEDTGRMGRAYDLTEAGVAAAEALHTNREYSDVPRSA